MCKVKEIAAQTGAHLYEQGEREGEGETGLIPHRGGEREDRRLGPARPGPDTGPREGQSEGDDEEGR